MNEEYKKRKVNRGKLWIGEEWKEAIKLSLDSSDCGVEEVWGYKYPNLLLNDKKVIVGYQIFGYGNGRKYKTRIPKRLNQFTKNFLENEEEKEVIK